MRLFLFLLMLSSSALAQELGVYKLDFKPSDVRSNGTTPFDISEVSYYELKVYSSRDNIDPTFTVLCKGGINDPRIFRKNGENWTYCAAAVEAGEYYTATLRVIDTNGKAGSRLRVDAVQVAAAPATISHYSVDSSVINLSEFVANCESEVFCEVKE